MKKNKFYIHYTILVILSVFLISMLVISTSQSNINIEYSFLDEVYVTNSFQVKIGEIQIENNNFLPRKTSLNSFILCSVNNTDPTSIYVEYRTKNNRFLSPSQKVSINGNSNMKLELFVGIWYFNLRDNNTSVPQILEFGIYSLEPSQDRFWLGTCETVSEDNLIQTITIKKNE